MALKCSLTDLSLLISHGTNLYKPLQKKHIASYINGVQGIFYSQNDNSHGKNISTFTWKGPPPEWSLTFVDIDGLDISRNVGKFKKMLLILDGLYLECTLLLKINAPGN